MKPQEMKDQMTTINTLPLDGERLLQIARDTGLRHHLRAVDSTAAGELLTRFAEAVINARIPALLDAIDGAITFGASGTNTPPSGHWLQRFWHMGRAKATHEEYARQMRAQALQEAAARLDARYNAVTGNQEYDKGRRDAYDVAESDILALKGAPAAAVAHTSDPVPVLAAALALLVAGDFVTRAKADEAIQIALNTPGAADLPLPAAAVADEPFEQAALSPAASAHLMANQVWAAAQLAPGEGIEDGVARISALLAPAFTADAELTDKAQRANGARILPSAEEASQ